MIRVYVKTGDPYSDMLKNLLKYYGIIYENIEVSTNPQKYQEMVQKSGQTKTPVIEIDDKVFSGFDREKIKEVLGIKNSNNSL